MPPAALVDDDDFAAPPPDAEEEGGRGQQSATSSGRGRGGRGRGRGRGAGAGRGVIQICIVPECDCARAANSKFCKPHHSSWQAFEIQQCDEDEEAQEVLAELKQKGNDEERGRALFAFCLLNPCDQKYVKKRFFDLIQFHKSRFTTTQKKEKKGERPMTQAAFGKYCENELGLTPDEIKAWWTELLDDPKTERDNFGFRGRQQLWVPLGASRSSGRIKGLTDTVTESSNAQKHYKKKDKDLLMGHLGKQRTSLADAFLSGPQTLDGMRGVKRKDAEANAKEGEVETASDKPPRKRKKTFDPDNDGPKFYQDMQTSLEKIDAKFVSTEKAFQKAVEELQKVPEDAKVKDPAMLGYIKKLQFRHQLFVKFKGSDTVTKLFNTYQKEGDPAPSPSLFPVDDVMAPTTPRMARGVYVSS